MAVYTPKTLVAITQLTNAAADVYTQPGATTTIVRTIWAQANSSGKTVTVSFGADAAATRIIDAFALTANVPQLWNGWWVIATGSTSHTIQAFASANTAVNIILGGYEYA